MIRVLNKTQREAPEKLRSPAQLKVSLSVFSEQFRLKEQQSLLTIWDKHSHTVFWVSAQHTCVSSKLCFQWSCWLLFSFMKLISFQVVVDSLLKVLIIEWNSCSLVNRKDFTHRQQHILLPNLLFSFQATLYNGVHTFLSKKCSNMIFIEIELYSFRLPFYPLAPPNCFALNPSYRLIACFIIIFIYVYIYVYVCIYTKIYKYNPLSSFLLFVGMWLQGWPLCTGQPIRVHPRERLILLLQAVISSL